MSWDGNFHNDGAMMPICSEREVEIAEYRQGFGAVHPVSPKSSPGPICTIILK